MKKNTEHTQQRFEHLESIIQRFRKNFYSVGKALKEIRDERHWKKLSFQSFESYVNKRWEMSKSSAYRLIDAAEVIDNLSPIGDIIPINEAQVRPLTKLDPLTQKNVWRYFLKSKKSLSALNIKKFIDSYQGNANNSIPFIEVISNDFKLAVDDLLYQITIAQNDNWTSTNRKTALYWNKVIKEKILWR
ncbi:DNA methylase [Candidatus Magnetomorum sp. HK-1]|nr:DNA methylase [Candidatus Magnetomorum sp. HK-1]